MKRYESVTIDKAGISHRSETRMTRTVCVPIRGYSFSAPENYDHDTAPPYPEEQLAVIRVSSYGDPTQQSKPELFIDCNYSIGPKLSKAIEQAIPLAWAEWEKAFGSR